MIENSVSYATFNGQGEEGDFIALAIKSFLDKGVKPNDIAIIYRTNRQSRAIEDGCLRQGVPYRIIGQAGFWARFYPRVIVSAFMLAAATKVDCLSNDDLAAAIAECIDKPNRFLGKRAAETAAYLDPSDPLSGLSRAKMNRRQLPNRDAFQDALYAARKRIGVDPVASIMADLADALGLTEWLKSAAGEDDATPESNGDGQLPILVEVMRAMEEYGTDATAFLTYVKGQTHSAAKAEDIATDQGKVTMLTIHRSKGLQWPVVFVPGMIESIMPHKMAADAKAIEEERRIAYVGMSRAESFLIVTSPSTFPCEPGVESISRFVTEAGLPAYTIEIEGEA